MASIMIAPKRRQVAIHNGCGAYRKRPCRRVMIRHMPPRAPFNSIIATV
jgi:hypothetical protein